ncbi:hypothetical protein AURDEDRAFT_116320, partial [Auricularia subglabra TFB-10046 SS5]
MPLNASAVHAAVTRVPPESARYLRVAGMTIAAWEYINTLSAEYRFYSSQERVLRPSLACILFILIRYISVVLVIVGSFGFFGHFTDEQCQRFYLAAPALKVVQTLVSQAILGLRTFAISNRSRQIGYGLAALLTVVGTLEAVVTFYGRIPDTDPTHTNCTSGNKPGERYASLHYIFAMGYDLVCTIISSWHLLGRGDVKQFTIPRLCRVMLMDGLMYFGLLTGVNTLNIIMFRSTPVIELQSAAAVMGYVLTWVMSQRILINIREMAQESLHNFTFNIPSVRTADARSGLEMGLRVSIPPTSPLDLALRRSPDDSPMKVH